MNQLLLLSPPQDRAPGSKPNNHLIPAANQIADPVDIPHARDYLVMIVNRENAQFPERQIDIDQLVSDIKSSYKKDIIEVDSDSKQNSLMVQCFYHPPIYIQGDGCGLLRTPSRNCGWVGGQTDRQVAIPSRQLRVPQLRVPATAGVLAPGKIFQVFIIFIL